MRSKSAKDLAEALGCLRTLTPDPRTHNIINWGGGGSFAGLNKPDCVSKAINKIVTLRELKANQVRVPDFTTSRELAKRWVDQGDTVMCRTTTTGHSGQGIVVARISVDLVDAPLYTKFINKDKEFRIHVFNGEVIDQRQKVPARDGRAITSQYINTHSNGYVFDFCNAPVDAHEQAIKAVQALGLDFGAVDVVVETIRGTGGIGISYKAYVLEVNTAPGLTGATIQNYANAIKRKFNQT
jgi:glutathione synthase/RimK-type ligase-like ATP-grasp enzyme